MAKSKAEINAMTQLRIAAKASRPVKNGKPANWAGRLKARVKVEMAKRAQKKAYKNLSAAEKRDEGLKATRTRYIEAAKTGIKSDVQKRRLRGK